MENIYMDKDEHKKNLTAFINGGLDEYRINNLSTTIKTNVITYESSYYLSHNRPINEKFTFNKKEGRFESEPIKESEIAKLEKMDNVTKIDDDWRNIFIVDLKKFIDNYNQQHRENKIVDYHYRWYWEDGNGPGTSSGSYSLCFIQNEKCEPKTAMDFMVKGLNQSKDPTHVLKLVGLYSLKPNKKNCYVEDEDMKILQEILNKALEVEVNNIIKLYQNDKISKLKFDAYVDKYKVAKEKLLPNMAKNWEKQKPKREKLKKQIEEKQRKVEALAKRKEERKQVRAARIKNRENRILELKNLRARRKEQQKNEHITKKTKNIEFGDK